MLSDDDDATTADTTAEAVEAAMPPARASVIFQTLREMLKELAAFFGDAMESLYVFSQLLNQGESHFDANMIEVAHAVSVFCHANRDDILTAPLGSICSLSVAIFASPRTPAVFYVDFANVLEVAYLRKAVHEYLLTLLGLYASDASTKEAAKLRLRSPAAPPSHTTTATTTTTTAAATSSSSSPPPGISSIMALIASKMEAPGMKNLVSNPCATPELAVQEIMKTGILSDIFSMFQTQDGQFNPEALSGIMSELGPMIASMST